MLSIKKYVNKSPIPANPYFAKSESEENSELFRPHRKDYLWYSYILEPFCIPSNGTTKNKKLQYMMPESLRFVDIRRLCARGQSIFLPVQFSHQRWVQNCSNLDRSIYHQDRDNEKFVIDVVIRKKVHHSFRPILTVPKSSMFDTPEAFPTIFHCRIRYEEHLSNCYPKTLAKAQRTGPRIECFHQSNITS